MRGQIARLFLTVTHRTTVVCVQPVYTVHAGIDLPGGQLALGLTRQCERNCRSDGKRKHGRESAEHRRLGSALSLFAFQRAVGTLPW